MLDVLYEDNHCLVLNKPAGLLSQGDETGEPTVLETARSYLKVRYDKPGKVYLGLVHRLDRPTSGAILLARTSKAAARLSVQFREGSVEKVYWVVVEGQCPTDFGHWTDTLLKNERKNVVDVVPPGTPGGQRATLDFRVIERAQWACWLEVSPATGRGHQIRVQLASRGLPVVGDRKYGAKTKLSALDGKPRVALHAYQLTFMHPTRQEAIVVTAPVPADWPERWRGGSLGSPSS
jgi:23S rRNA pseudouridine1911/1915/1917 synthase